MLVAQLQRLTRACGVAYQPSVQLRTTVSETGPAGPAAQLRVGDSLTTERVFGHDDVRTYCMLTGDSNPIHTDKARTGDFSLDSFRLAALSESPVWQAAARAAGLESCLVPGMLLASLFPAIVGSHLVRDSHCIALAWLILAR
jgi:acyl dehydratase